jgi:hypothetical protein
MLAESGKADRIWQVNNAIFKSRNTEGFIAALSYCGFNFQQGFIHNLLPRSYCGFTCWKLSVGNLPQLFCSPSLSSIAA